MKTAQNESWQLRVFAVSVRKKEKWLWAKPKVLQALQKKAKDCPCLDIGSGVGTLSVLLERLGGTWEFTETDAAAAAETRKIVHGLVHEIDIYNPLLSRSSFKIVTIFDVIEHVQDPASFMRRVSELLTPDGVVILTTPADDGRPYFWRHFAENVFGIDKAAHGHVVEGFSKSTLQKLTDSAGLIVKDFDLFSFFFTEMVELAYNGFYILKNRSQQKTAGYNLALSPASEGDVNGNRQLLGYLRIVYPLLRLISRLDHFFRLKRGYEWGLVAHKIKSSNE